MSDALDEAYEKYLKPPSDTETDPRIDCPKCGSDNVDIRAGYRGEYKCLDCGHYWQVGGIHAS